MLTKEQDNDATRLKDPETGTEYEIIDKILLMEWLAENYKQYGSLRGGRTVFTRFVMQPSWYETCSRFAANRNQARVHHQQVPRRSPVRQGLWRHWRCVTLPTGGVCVGVITDASSRVHRGGKSVCRHSALPARLPGNGRRGGWQRRRPVRLGLSSVCFAPPTTIESWKRARRLAAWQSKQQRKRRGKKNGCTGSSLPQGRRPSVFACRVVFQ